MEFRHEIKNLTDQQIEDIRKIFVTRMREIEAEADFRKWNGEPPKRTKWEEPCYIWINLREIF